MCRQVDCKQRMVHTVTLGLNICPFSFGLEVQLAPCRSSRKLVKI